MRKEMLLVIMCAAMALVSGKAWAEALINGAGATFPYPLYSKWVYEYGKITGAKINYQSIGSGGGIRQIKAKTVDFGASDAPLEFNDLEESGLMQFPAAVGGVVPVVNIKGIGPGELKLTPGVLADIYLGKIEKWDDKAIQALNPGLKLPSDSITVVRRSDGSGTTWIFTNYLSKVSAEWKDKVGFGTAVNWPAGVGGKGNEGVANYVKRIKNTIGYVELVYALQNKLTYTSLQNKEKNFVQPSKESFIAAASGADWKGTPGFSVVLTDQPGKDSWPMAGATFILVHKNPQNCGNARAVLEFFDWAYQNGAEMATALDYVPIPKNVYSIVEDTWASQIACGGEQVWKK
ncbi:MAG: phosphate ABC transporter substrate-binding protein PstS [Deltaproteobacteria bacterium]|nr:phosphate ABC transporter substrate-binding protein PstS [Deltaproteobacteria bacterium]MCL4873759.1 phosphate ABC transporter substrate-binding protein PstS [bacterium]